MTLYRNNVISYRKILIFYRSSVIFSRKEVASYPAYCVVGMTQRKINMIVVQQ